MPHRINSPRRLFPSWWRANSPSLSRRDHQLAPRLDGLEDRVVLSRFGTVAAAVAAAQATGTGSSTTDMTPLCADTSTDSTTTTTATTSLSASSTRGRGRGGRGGVQDSQLSTDLQQLRTDMNSVLAGSSVTDAQRLALRNDLKALSQAGFRLDPSTLSPVIESMLTSLADGTYDSDASVAQANRDAFEALFQDSSVDEALIDATYDDLVTIARNLNISTEELQTLSADRTAIQDDLTRLGISNTKGASQSNLDFIIMPGVHGGFRRGRGF